MPEVDLEHVAWQHGRSPQSLTLFSLTVAECCDQVLARKKDEDSRSTREMLYETEASDET